MARQSSFQVPAAQGFGGLDDDLFAGTGSKDGSSNFKVVIRFRPMNGDEREANEARCISCNPNSITITKPTDQKEHTYAYDRVYAPEESQETVYNSAIKSVALSSLDGYNGSIIAYGQTGTGKTHTMEGDHTGEERGIIPRASEEIFDFVDKASQDDSKFLVRISFLQIYNEVIADLLDEDSMKKVDQKGYLALREDPNGGVYVNNLSEHIVKNSAEIVALLVKGSKQRTVASTKMNRTSSRSHAVFTMIIEHSEMKDGENIVTIGKLNLVDLAGSERIKSTGITNADTKRMGEAKKINSSLTAFGKVILALTSPGNHHVPYRDSKLTRMLQGSLGGNCKTTMITACGPAARNYVETLNSLKFASRAKNVKNYAVVNQDMSDQALLSAYQKEIENLKLQLARSATPALEPQVIVDTEALDALREKHTELESQNTMTQTELKTQAEKISQVETEKIELQKRMEAMTAQLLSGGSKIEEHPEFRKTVSAVESRLQTDYERKLAELESEKQRVEAERLRFAHEKAEFEAMREGFTRTQSDLQASLAAAHATNAANGQMASTHSPDPPQHPHTQPHPPPGGGRPPPRAGMSPQPPPAGARRSPTRRAAPAANSNSWVAPGSDDEGPPPLSPYTRVGSASSVAYEEEPPADRRLSTQSVREPRQSEISMMSAYSVHGHESPTVEEAEPEVVGLDIYLKALRDPNTGIPTTDARHNHQYHRGVFSGKTAMDWFIKNMEGVDTPELAQSVGQKFLNLDVFTSLDSNDVFCTGETDMFSFVSFDSARSLRPKTPVTVRSPRGSVSVSVPRRWQAAAGMGQANLVVSAFQGGGGWDRPQTTQSMAGGRPSASQIEEMERRPSTSSYGGPMSTPISPGYQDGGEGPPSSRNRPSTASRLRRRVSSLLSSASNLGSPSNAEQSMSSWADPNASQQSAAAQDPAMQQMLAEAEAAGATLLHSAAAQGDRPAMKSFFNTFPVDCVDKVGRTPLLYAAINNKVKAVELLIKQGCDLTLTDNTGRSGLFFAAYYGHNDVLKVLLRTDRQLALASDPEGRTAIHWATKHATTKCLDLLLKVCPPAIINVQDAERVTALHWAVLCHNDEHVGRLAKAGAGLAISDGDGRTSIHYAVCNDAQRCLYVLLQQDGMDKAINIKDNRGRTALHLSIGADTPVTCCNLLLDNGHTDVNCTDSSMRTPLHWAAVCNRPDVCLALCQRGANQNYRDVTGRTPMHYASEKNNEAVMQALHQLIQGGGKA
jgi:ankyrin repeat protein